jgi:hypothetical protein
MPPKVRIASQLAGLVGVREETTMAAALLRAMGLATALLAVSALAAPLDDVHEVTLDIDQDGRADRAALVRNKTSGDLDLYIYSGAGDAKLDISHKPTSFKTSLATGLVLAFEQRGKGSLIVTTGCGGCSNDWSITLTIAHRGGEFLVAGFTREWETRVSAGTCAVNFLTGRGTLTRNGAKARPLAGKFVPIKLADWSSEKHPKACD